MKIKIIPFSSLPCEAQDFKINDKSASKSDFGSNSDCGSFDYEYGPYDDENWACADNQFIRHEIPPEGVLKRYNITLDEYREIQKELGSQFSVGSCGWCV